MKINYPNASDSIRGVRGHLGIYPTQLNDSNYARLTKGYSKNKDKISLWADLKKSYDLFNQTKVPPVVSFLPDGTHEVN